MQKFDWHKDNATKNRLIDNSHKNTQNPGRFFMSASQASIQV